MAQFKTRAEYEAWKAGQAPGSAPAGARGSGDAPAGFSVAKTKPRLRLLLPAAVIMVACSVFLFATGDLFSGFFVLALGGGIAAIYARFRLRPELDDAEVLKTTLRAVAGTALRHGRVSQEEIEAVKRAEEASRARIAAAKARPGD